jgi:hypothetical protein
MKAWHFLAEDKKLSHGDGRVVEVGKTLTCDPEKVKICVFGFHGALRAIDALYYAPGPVVCWVELGGRTISENDKTVASERTVLWMADATKVLHEFACQCAEDVLPIWEDEYPDDPRPRQSIKVKRKWMRGEATDDQLARAAGAARSAAEYAAEYAARSAAEYAAGAAARSAAEYAAESAEYAAWSAARSSAEKEQNDRLTQMLNESAAESAEAAACAAAARFAARSSAEKEQNDRLTKMLNELESRDE